MKPLRSAASCEAHLRALIWFERKHFDDERPDRTIRSFADLPTVFRSSSGLILILSLPLHPSMSIPDQERVIESVRAFYTA